VEADRRILEAPLTQPRIERGVLATVREAAGAHLLERPAVGRAAEAFGELREGVRPLVGGVVRLLGAVRAVAGVRALVEPGRELVVRRELARHVAAHLTRFDIGADDRARVAALEDLGLPAGCGED